MKEKNENQIKKHEQEQTYNQSKYEQEKTFNEKPKLTCRTCKKEIVPKFRCVCAGGGGDKEEDDNEKDQDKDSKYTTSSGQATNASEQAPHFPKMLPDFVSPRDEEDESDDLENAETADAFDHEIIMALLERGSLLILVKNNELTIACDGSLSRDELIEVGKFFCCIGKEFKKFVQQHGIAKDECSLEFGKDDNENIRSLSIKMSNPELFAQFIHQLNENVGNYFDDAKSLEKPFNPSPFSTTLTPFRLP